jgi:hypothetical protein
MSAELSALFIEQTKKLAALAAAVGVHGDQSAEGLAAAGRRLVEEKKMMETKLTALREENERLRLSQWNGEARP